MPKPGRKFVNISHTHKVAYYLVPKSASTSIRYAIGCDSRAFNIRTDQWEQWEREDKSKQYLIFSSIRNPWDRLVSAWAHAIEGAGTTPVVIGRLIKDMDLPVVCDFKKFARRACEISDLECNMHYRSQYLFVPENTDMILRYETIVDDWGKLQSRRSSLPDLGLHETSDHKHYLSYYDSELVDLVSKRYAIDIETFGWEIPKV